MKFNFLCNVQIFTFSMLCIEYIKLTLHTMNETFPKSVRRPTKRNLITNNTPSLEGPKFCEL